MSVRVVAMSVSVLAFGGLGVLAQPRVFEMADVRHPYSEERGYGFDLNTAPANEAPFFFSVKVPEGNWRVTVMLGDARQAARTTVKAESRRLMVHDVVTAPGEFVWRTFTVNVRNPQLPAPPLNAPGGAAVRLNDREQDVLHWDEKLTLEFAGPEPRVVRIAVEPAADSTTVFLAGDSTVTDQPYEPAASWGQMLPVFFKAGIAVANHAESGETLKSFLTSLRFDKLLSQLKPGDFVFVQFGHNDSKAQWPQTYAEAGTTYEAYLRAYVAEIRRRGGRPVLVTPVHRRVFDDRGRIQNTHGSYPDAVRAVAGAEGVPLIDLTEMTGQLYEALGPARAPLAFNQGGRDATHHNNYGAFQIARCVVEGIRSAVPALAEHLADDERFDPGRPDPPEVFSLAESARRSTMLPRGN